MSDKSSAPFLDQSMTPQDLPLEMAYDDSNASYLQSRPGFPTTINPIGLLWCDVFASRAVIPYTFSCVSSSLSANGAHLPDSSVL